MPKTMIERILADHARGGDLEPGDIVDIKIDARCARDFGGANVVKNLQDFGLEVQDPEKTYFTFDCNPCGSDQKYAVNQHICRLYAREKGIRIFDINQGIGTHLAIDQGIAYPGCTFVSTDSHANIMGAIGAFGQGMGDKDIAAVFAQGRVWFKVPESVKITLTGKRDPDLSAKDIVLNLLSNFGANQLLGYSVELVGPGVENLNLDERITIASMATEMGAIAILIPPSGEILWQSERLSGRKLAPVTADKGAGYLMEKELNLADFVPRVSLPGHPEDTRPLDDVKGIKIDSVFIGSCTNGRMTDLRAAADILKNRKVAPGVILKIVPATDQIWNQTAGEGLINIFKEAGALVSNAGCAGCAAGQVGQNGPGEVVVSTGNRNFAGKQGKGEVYLASVQTAAASAVAGYLTSRSEIPEVGVAFNAQNSKPCPLKKQKAKKLAGANPLQLTGRVWLIDRDDIDTDMIFHNRYLAITSQEEMGQYTFDNLEGYRDFASRAKAGDIIITGKNFGAGSSRQQAVDCFKSLGIQAILAESFGAIYERNAINNAFPVLTYKSIPPLALKDGDMVKIDLKKGIITSLKNSKSITLKKFSTVQTDIYLRGGLLN